ncbi:unnamed protein product, partial [Rotaria magnacalcarata]
TSVTKTTTTSTTTTTGTICFTVPTPPPSNAWFFVGNMSSIRYLHTSTLISQDDSVLITGGYNAVVGLASTENYIPSTGCFQTMSSMSVARYLHTADQLSSLSSFVIIAGGYNTVSGVLNTADLFDPMTGNIITISLTSLRYAHRSVLFNASKLVLIGGGNGVTTIATGYVLTIGSPSLFTNANNAMLMAPFWHTVTDLGDNSYLVLIAGGMDGSTTFFSAIALYQASLKAFISLVAGVNMPTTRAYHTATYLPAPYNQVLLTGGNLDSTTWLHTLALFDAASLQFIPLTSTMSNQRSRHTATLLFNGKILLVGGYNGIVGLNTCELIDPSNNFLSTPTANLNIGRYNHTATLLSSSENSTVLVCGGYNTLLGPVNSCELYFV